MTERIIASIVAFILAINGGVLANIFIFRMIAEINRRRSDTDQISHFAFTFPKVLMIFSEYPKCYPKGRLHFYAMSAFGFGVTALIVAAACIGIIG